VVGPIAQIPASAENADPLFPLLTKDNAAKLKLPEPLHTTLGPTSETVTMKSAVVPVGVGVGVGVGVFVDVTVGVTVFVGVGVTVGVIVFVGVGEGTVLTHDVQNPLLLR
jgi:amino acid transporter